MPRLNNLPDPWRSLVAKLGSVRAIADALKVTPRTVHRWAWLRRMPHPNTYKAILALFDLHGLDHPYFR